MHKVTKIWLDEFVRGAGGYTLDQLDAIGVPWPPKVGWKLRAVGREISDEDRLRFEAKRTVKDLKAARSVLL